MKVADLKKLLADFPDDQDVVVHVVLAKSPADSANVAICENCAEPFQRGPDTGRRADAKFCTDHCKVDFHSKKRSRPSV